MRTPYWVTMGLSISLKLKAQHLPGPNWYKFLYLRLGGLPFTYQMRCWSRHPPMPTMLGFALLLYLGYMWLGKTALLLTGILFGHVFWGGQRTT